MRIFLTYSICFPSDLEFSGIVQYVVNYPKGLLIIYVLYRSFQYIADFSFWLGQFRNIFARTLYLSLFLLLFIFILSLSLFFSLSFSFSLAGVLAFALSPPLSPSFLYLSFSLYLSIYLSINLSFSLSLWDIIIPMYLWFWKCRGLFFCLRKRYNGVFLGIFRGSLDLFDPSNNYVKCPIICFALEKK
jgi:hypothetical protein